MVKLFVIAFLICSLFAGAAPAGEIQEIQADWEEFRRLSELQGGQTDLKTDGRTQLTEIYTLSTKGASLINMPGRGPEVGVIRCWIRNEDYSASLRCETSPSSVLTNSLSEMKWSLDGIYWNGFDLDSQSKAAELLRSPNLFALGSNYGFDSLLESGDFDCTVDVEEGAPTVVTATGKAGTDEAMRKYIAELDPEYLHVLTRLEIHDPDGSVLTCQYRYDYNESLAVLREIDYGVIKGKTMKLMAALARSEVPDDSQFRLPYFGIPEPASPVNPSRGLFLVLVVVASALLVIGFAVRAKRGDS